MRRPKQSRQAGFTLIELLLVIGLLAVVGAFVIVNLLQPQATASLTGITSSLTSDIKNQQLKSMVGDGGSNGAPDNYGIFIQSNQYVLFKGTSFTGSTDNFTVPAPAGTTFATTFPSGQLVFTKGSGDTTANGTYTITISNNTGQVKTLSINRHGAVAES